jgi:hypothetical protein
MVECIDVKDEGILAREMYRSLLQKTTKVEDE